MSRAESDLAERASFHAMIVVHEPGKPYYLRTWDGNTFGPFTPKTARIWLAGYSHGASAHELGCGCGRVSCNHRNAVLGGAL